MAAWMATLAAPVLASAAEDPAYLPWARRLDQYQEALYVYDDYSSAGNHFHERGLIGPTNAYPYISTMEEDCRESPFSGNTCIRCVFRDAPHNWGGWLFLNGVYDADAKRPRPDWGRARGAGYDLTGATQLTFRARGRDGGERVEFFCGGVGRGPGTGVPTERHPDSLTRISLGCVTLSNTWQEYSIPLDGADLARVINGFGWQTTAARNRGRTIEFFLDDIRYDLPRPDEPRFLASYPDVGPSNRLDLVLRNVALARDNAVALMTFLRYGDLRRARLIADAFVYAQAHDRYFRDGRLRNAYQAGDLALPPGWVPRGRPATARMPGWYDPDQLVWIEDKTQVGTGAGDLAWAMMALVECYEKTGDSRYLSAAQKLGRWVTKHCRERRAPGGYSAGVEGWEPRQTRLTQRSTEDNFDLYSAFERLYGVSRSRTWRKGANHALRFLLAMWDEASGAFHAGIRADGSVNPAEIALPYFVARTSMGAKRARAAEDAETEAEAPRTPAADDAVESRVGLPLATELVAEGLVSPVVLTHAGDGSGRLFIAEQTGQIRILKDGELRPSPFLDLSAKMAGLAPTGIGGYNEPGLNPWYDERGLLGLAFHPDYRNNGRFFVFYTLPKSGRGVDHENIVAEYRVSPDDPDRAATDETVILRADQPEFNHCGGGLAFGPDGFLYVGLGDGGGGGDVHGAIGHAQDTSTLPGSILRLDVDGGPSYAVPPDNPFVGTAERDEIYAYGFRNPCRLSFDRGGAHALVVPDTGMNVWEEINFVEKGGNYGWRIFEGSEPFDAPLGALLGLRPADLRFPAHEYGLGPAGLFVVGGHAYRGAAYPELAGAYVYGYFTMRYSGPDGLLCYLAETNPGTWERFEFSLPGGERLERFVKGFGEGEDGELYVLTSGVPGPSGASADVRRLRKP